VEQVVVQVQVEHPVHQVLQEQVVLREQAVLMERQVQVEHPVHQVHQGLPVLVGHQEQAVLRVQVE
jgi:hypothetical protein